MNDDRYTRRYNRRMNRYRNPMRGIATGIFFIFLAFAFYFSNTFNSDLFLPIFFAGLALVSLIRSCQFRKPARHLWRLISLCLANGSGPVFSHWLLALDTFTHRRFHDTWSTLQSNYYRTFQCRLHGKSTSPSTIPLQQSNEPNQSYQAGYQGSPPVSDTYQEGGQYYQYPPQPKQQYDYARSKFCSTAGTTTSAAIICSIFSKLGTSKRSYCTHSYRIR